jgi:hypothetical protein
VPVILASQEMEIGRPDVQSQTRQKVSGTHINEQVGVLAFTCNPSYMGGVGRNVVHGWPGKNPMP